MRVRIVLVLVIVAGVSSACSDDPCSAPQPNENSVALDISGAANTACTLTITLEGKSLTFDVAASNPAVANSSLDTRSPAAFFACDSTDGGVPAAVTPANDIAVLRSSTRMCVTQSQLLTAFPQRAPDACTVTLSLTCANVSFYDGVTWDVCSVFC